MPSSPAVRLFTAVIASIAAVVMTAVLLILVFGWNWLRTPLEHYTHQATGRVLKIDGDLTVQLGWPATRLRAGGVQFANPAWAQEKQMLTATGVEVSVDLQQLLRRKIVFPEVTLNQAELFFEQGAGGRKSWLLDLEQQSEDAQFRVGRITLDRATLGYDDLAQGTRVRSALSTLPASATGSTVGLTFAAQGQFKGLALHAQGNGGPVLGLRDSTQPYPLQMTATVGFTHVKVDGTVTGLLALTAVDLKIALEGRSLEQLYPLLGIAFPVSRAYFAAGHLLHYGNTWRYEDFAGRVGTSDLAGYVQVVNGAKRPLLTADLHSQLLSMDELGPLIGARQGSLANMPAAILPGEIASLQKQPRVLPALPFHTERWNSVDADVKLQAKTIASSKALPFENLQAHLLLQDSVLTLEPITFGFSGGKLSANVTLDGRHNPILARANVRARKLQLGKMFPALDLTKKSLGELNGDFDLMGNGNSVGRMLATSNGKLAVMVSGGQISRLLMEKAGLHVWEIVTLTLTGDKLVKLRCFVADFEVKQGTMKAQALVFDTQVTTLMGSGTIDLAKEQLDLKLDPHTKTTSPLALRSPIYVRGSFAKPVVGVDKGKVALRAAGAVVLSMLNPFLALLPLVDTGPGKDTDCTQFRKFGAIRPTVQQRTEQIPGRG